MPQDPFPLTANDVTEHRFRTIFSALSMIDVLPDTPLKPREGQMWVNKNTGKVHVFVGGAVRTLTMED